jgi:hypothetical protein
MAAEARAREAVEQSAVKRAQQAEARASALAENIQVGAFLPQGFDSLSRAGHIPLHSRRSRTLPLP